VRLKRDLCLCIEHMVAAVGVARIQVDTYRRVAGMLDWLP
jgi:hypothetical protein